MKIDTTIDGPLTDGGARAVEAERAGFDAVWSTEVAHDPFLPLALAAGATGRIGIGTGIAVAFGRSPLTVAHTAWDLNAGSGGRFLLGLGSQIRPHIERRYSMPWSRPAARMAEYIGALRAIWAAWADGAGLDFVGEFYHHTLMTPFFTPEPSRAGPPPVVLAAVGEQMTRVAAEHADGLLVHSFTTSRYLRETTLPLVAAGLADASRTRDTFQVICPAVVVTGDTQAQLDAAAEAARAQIAFYGSTPAYRAVLDLHGWSGVGEALHRLSRQGRWAEMAELVGEEMLAAFAVVAPPEQVAEQLQERYGGLADRVQLTLAGQPGGGSRAGAGSGAGSSAGTGARIVADLQRMRTG